MGALVYKFDNSFIIENCDIRNRCLAIAAVRCDLSVASWKEAMAGKVTFHCSE